MTIPENNLPLIFISTNGKSSNVSWKSITETTINGGDGIALLTGYKTNIMVVDLDYMKKLPNGDMDDYKTNPFYLHYGNIQDIIEDNDTFTVKSKNDGYHLYFLYDADITQTQNKETKVDIRSNGGYIMTPPTSGYKIVRNTSVKKIPKELKTWLLINLYSKNAKKGKRTTDAEKVMKMTTKTGKHETISNWKFRITGKDMKTILNRLPKKPDNINEDFRGCYDLWFKVGLACKYTGHKKEFFKWSSSTPFNNYNEEEIEASWNIWTGCHTNFKFLLWHSKTKDRFTYKEYVNEIDNFKIINKEKLDDLKLNRFFKNNKNYMVKSDTGTGKTTAFREYIKKNKLPFISIVLRITLGEDHFKGFTKDGINVKMYKIGDEIQELKDGDNIIITPNSLPRLMDYDFSKYVLFLDELDALTDYIINCDTSSMKKNRILIMGILTKMMTDCKAVIGVDADISSLSQTLMDQVKIDYKFIKNEYQNYKGINVNIMNNETEFFTLLKSKDKFLLASDSKTEVELAELKIKGGEDIVLITSDTSNADLDAHNKVMFSPKITNGVDSQMRRDVFCYYKGLTISPLSMVQQITRCRNIDNIYMYFKPSGQTTTNSHYDNKKDMMKVFHTMKAQLHASLAASCSEEEYHEFEEYHFEILETAQKTFEKLFFISEYRNDCFNTNKYLHVLDIMEARGFNLIFDDKEAPVKIDDKDLKKQLKAIKEEKFSIDNQNVQRINEYLKIPTKKIEDFKDYFINTFKLYNHFNYCKYYHGDKMDHIDIMKDHNDYDIKKCNSFESRLVLLDDILNVLETDKHDITEFVPEGMVIKGAKKLIDRYDLGFKTKRKLLGIDEYLYNDEGYAIMDDNGKHMKYKFTDEDLYTVVKKMYSIMFDITETKSSKDKSTKEYEGKRGNKRYIVFKHDIIQENEALLKYRTPKPMKKLV
jgi:hypothetical protein